MTPHQQETKRRAEVMLAYAEGKEIEMKGVNASTWKSLAGTVPEWSWTCYDYRVKPAPTTRPWFSEDVPPVCWLHHTRSPSTHFDLVTAIRHNGVILKAGEDLVTWGELQRNYEYSTDLRMWKKPEVEV